MTTIKTCDWRVERMPQTDPHKARGIIRARIRHGKKQKQLTNMLNFPADATDAQIIENISRMIAHEVQRYVVYLESFRHSQHKKKPKRPKWIHYQPYPSKIEILLRTTIRLI